MDYRKYYNLETYLLDEVGVLFRTKDILSVFNFHCILIWKAERVKNVHKKRLQRIAGGTYAEAVARLTTDLVRVRGSTNPPKESLRVLMEQWEFKLATASAILTILYPNEFTVYDTRVCGRLGRFTNLKHHRYTDKLWSRYCEFKAAVQRAAPAKYSLRDKDRYLWGLSFAEQVQHEVA